MKTTIVIVLFLSMLAVRDFAMAGNTESIRVSCVIPAIPGVNAPAMVTQEELPAATVLTRCGQPEDGKQDLISDEAKTFGREQDSRVQTVYAR